MSNRFLLVVLWLAIAIAPAVHAAPMRIICWGKDCYLLEGTCEGFVPSSTTSCFEMLARANLGPGRTDFAFTGGVFVDGLVNPSYVLEPLPTDGNPRFVIVDDREARDRFSAGITVMGHLVRARANPESTLSWVPLSIGAGVASRSGPRLLVGTSLEIGRRTFLTAGAAVGARERLRAGTKTGDVTSDPNVLVDLPVELRTTWMVSLSYRFGADRSDRVTRVTPQTIEH